MFTLVYNIALLVSLTGLDQSFVRYYYQEEEKSELFWSCLFLPIAFGTFVSFVFILFESPFSLILYDKNYQGIGLFFTISLMTGILQRFNQLSIRMQKRGLFYSLLDVANSLGNVGGSVVFAVVISRNFYAIVFGQIIGNILALCLGFLLDRASRKLSTVNFKRIGEFLKYGLPLLPTYLLFWLFSSIDRISLRQYSNFTEIGLYSAAFKIVSVMMLFQTGFTTFWVPTAYEKYETQSDPKRFFKKANNTVSFVIFLFGLLVLAFKDVIFLLFEKSYRDASFIAPFLILQPVMYVISETTVLGINFTKKTHWHIAVTGLAALFNFVGNQLLVPHLGAKGAALSTGLSYILFFTLRTIIAEKLYPIGFNLKKIYIGTLIISSAAFFGTFLKNTPVFLSVTAAGVLLILLLYKTEMTFLKNQLKSFK
jgi:O-antigen/teichoic acid export membrane protein